MLNINDETAVQKALEELTDNNEVFTSVHVANHVKRNGTWIRNRDVAAYLRRYFPFLYGGEYNVTYSVDIGNGIHAAVYHPIGVDPEGQVTLVNAMTPDEFAKLHGANPVAASVPPPVSTSVDVDTVGDVDDDPPAQTMAVADDDDSDAPSNAKDRIASFFKRKLNFPKGA